MPRPKRMPHWLLSASGLRAAPLAALLDEHADDPDWWLTSPEWLSFAESAARRLAARLGPEPLAAPTWSVTRDLARTLHFLPVLLSDRLPERPWLWTAVRRMFTLRCYGAVVDLVRPASGYERKTPVGSVRIRASELPDWLLALTDSSPDVLSAVLTSARTHPGFLGFHDPDTLASRAVTAARALMTQRPGPAENTQSAVAPEPLPPEVVQADSPETTYTDTLLTLLDLFPSLVSHPTSAHWVRPAVYELFARRDYLPFVALAARTGKRGSGRLDHIRALYASLRPTAASDTEAYQLVARAFAEDEPGEHLSLKTIELALTLPRHRRAGT